MAIQETKENLERWLNKIERSGLPGRFKAWIYQNAVLPKVLWQLTVYEFTSSSVEQLEKKINSTWRRWLGLPKCLSSAALYGGSNALQLPFKSLVKEYKITKVKTSTQFMISKDPPSDRSRSRGIHRKEMESGKRSKSCRGTAAGKRNFRGRGYWPRRLRLLPHYQGRQDIRKREASITTKRDT